MAYRNQNPSGRRPQRMTASADTAQEARVDVFRWPSMSILRSSVLPPWLHPSHHVASCACRVRDKEPQEGYPLRSMFGCARAIAFANSCVPSSATALAGENCHQTRKRGMRSVCSNVAMSTSAPSAAICATRRTTTANNNTHRIRTGTALARCREGGTADACTGEQS